MVALLQKKAEQSTVSKGPAASAALTIPVISDQSLGISRLVYGDGKAKEEKDARAKEMSAIKRMLSQNSIVIVDCLNYIKGYRYQIYCESKAARTTSCVV